MEVITKMANTIRIKRRGSGGATGAPTSLENAELAFNEADNILYYGKGTGGAGGTASTIEVIGGIGAFVTNSTTQTVTGAKTFSGTIIVPTPTANTHAATKAYVDSAVSGVTLSNTAVAAGTYGNSTAVGTFSVDAQGRLTAASNTLIAVSTAMIADRAVTAVKLANTAVAEGTYGNASAVGSFSVDAQGRLVSASNSAISIASTAVTDFNEAAQDAYGTLITNSTQTGITVAYDDANTKVTYSVTKSGIGLGNVDNTADTAKPVSTAQQTALDLKANIASPTFTGAVTLPANTVTTTFIADSAVTTAKHADRSVTAIKLANTAVAEGTYGNATAVGSFSVDAQGRLVSASNSAIAIGSSQITDKATTLVTGLTGTSNQITVSNSGVGAVTLSLPSNVTIANDLTVTGDLTVQGNTVTLNTATLVVEDKNVVLANVATPTDITADGAGITVLGATNKTFNWVDATDAWTSSEFLNLLAGKTFQINGTSVLSNTTLGSGIVSSSLTSLGTISTGVWNGTTISGAYGGTGYNTYATGDLLYGYGSGFNKISIGTNGQFLKVDGMGVPSWSDTVDGGTF
jgi:hypothetical protein